MRPSVLTRLERLEAAQDDAAALVVALALPHESTRDAVERATAGRVIDGGTVIVVIHRLTEPEDGVT